MSAVVRDRSHRFSLSAFALVLLAGLMACSLGGASSSGEDTPPPQAETQAPVSPTAAPTETLPPLIFEASDSPSDCFDGFGQPDQCAGLDLVSVRVGLQEAALGLANEERLPVAIVIGFSEPLDGVEEFGLYLYLDQDPATGLDMSSGRVALPGIDRLIGATLPDADTWTQAVGNGGYEAEIIRDDRTSAAVEGDRVVILAGRGLLDENAPLTTRGSGGLARAALIVFGRPLLAGGAPDEFTLYVGTARGIQALDYFNIEGDIQVPLGLTVPTEVMYPLHAGGS